MILFLLRPNFRDGDEGPFFCPDSAVLEGFFQYAPDIQKKIDVRRIEFPRPRKEIVDLIGPEQQGCPVLIFTETLGEVPPEAKQSQVTGRHYISGNFAICNYLARTFGVAKPHP